MDDVEESVLAHVVERSQGRVAVRREDRTGEGAQRGGGGQLAAGDDREVLSDGAAQAGQIRLQQVLQAGRQAAAGALPLRLRLEPGMGGAGARALLEELGALVGQLPDRGLGLCMGFIQTGLPRLALGQRLLCGLDGGLGAFDRLVGACVLLLQGGEGGFRVLQRAGGDCDPGLQLRALAQAGGDAGALRGELLLGGGEAGFDVRLLVRDLLQ